MLTLLTLPNFRRLWLGEVVSLIGDRALLLALPYFLYRETGSTLATALLALSYYLPGLLFGSFAGVLADRWDRKRVLVITHLIQGALVTLLLLAPQPGLVWVAYAVTFAELTVSTLSTPVAGALLPSLVPEENLMRANAALSLGTTGARLLGPVVGGALIATFGIPGVVLFDAASFVLAALCFLRLRVPARVPADAPVGATALLNTWRDLGREWREGLRVIRRSPVILALLAVLSITSLGGTLIDPFYTPFLVSVLHADARTIGLLGTLGGLGALLGSAASAWLGDRVPPRLLIAFGTLLVGVLMLRMYSGASLPPLFALVPLLGVPMVVSNVALSTMIQTVTPDAYRGRVYGALGTTNALVGVLATAAAGLVGPRVGTVPMLVLAAGITLLGGVVALVFLPARAPGAEQGSSVG
ncbi:major facilitator superfamily MFS_1 [Deinococcus aerius]|uniref:Major facilitator superfamily MFS_1 n=1 Tax=Deinococcus aerius TaxID=200253 RepID=A0A2I9CXJ8_9DEIO|nr:MFS transporter [Deinococcus aerius]GBF06809.1 major facilitator superfamily MFS_1 [Deinococcus aerius]